MSNCSSRVAFSIDFLSSLRSKGKGWGSITIINCVIVFMWGLGLYNFTANCVFCDEFMLLECVEIVYANSVGTVMMIIVCIIMLVVIYSGRIYEILGGNC